MTTIYAISGLGADERVFNFVNTPYKIVVLKWLKPKYDESLAEYVIRLAEKINIKSDDVILGVSFGGLIAVELNKILNPILTILVSSVETKNELRKIYRLSGKINFLKYLPENRFKIPLKLAVFLFQAKNKKLLYSILKESDPGLTKWALIKLLKWENEKKAVNCIKISGDRDYLMPIVKDEKTIMIRGGGHFMIVDRADEISTIMNNKIQEHFQFKN